MKTLRLNETQFSGYLFCFRYRSGHGIPPTNGMPTMGGMHRQQQYAQAAAAGMYYGNSGQNQAAAIHQQQRDQGQYIQSY